MFYTSLKKHIFFLLLIVLNTFSICYAQVLTCNNVTITEVLAGPRHGAMLKLSDEKCGNHGYVCLDPNAEFMSSEVSARLYSFSLAMYLSKQPVSISYDLVKKPVSCNGGFPVVDDIRPKK